MLICTLPGFELVAFSHVIAFEQASGLNGPKNAASIDLLVQESHFTISASTNQCQASGKAVVAHASLHLSGIETTDTSDVPTFKMSASPTSMKCSQHSPFQSCQFLPI